KMEAPELNLDQSFADNLKNFQGKFVVINLMSGGEIKGFVKEVRSIFLRLEKIADRDYYDAMIRLDQISAIEVQVRGLNK
ncbi:MAG: hypothetical protein WCT39_05490, partial [Candidatus Margulisiibacteriota bacterium]